MQDEIFGLTLLRPWPWPDMERTQASQAQGKALFAKLERPVRQAVRPKAALAFADDGQGRRGLYAVLTTGPAVSRQSRYVRRPQGVFGSRPVQRDGGQLLVFF